MARISPDAPRADRDLLRPGPYLLALVWFQRKTGKESGNRYLSCKFEVVGGRAKGATFFSVMGLDLSKTGTVTRWQIFSQACAVQEEFELGEYDEGTEAEGDDNLRRLFLGVPFGAEVTSENQGQYSNNGVGKFIMHKVWLAPWAQWAQEWNEARAARSQRRPEDDVDDPAPNSPEDVGYPPDDGFGSDERPPPPPPAAADDDSDDIPF